MHLKTFKIDIVGYTPSQDSLMMITLSGAFPYPGFNFVKYYMDNGFAQNLNETIEGGVINKQMVEPISKAGIYIAGTFMGAATDQEGCYIIEKVKPGRYFMLCSAIGFRKQEPPINVLPAKKSRVGFELEETAVQMPGIIVTASKFSQAIEDVPVTISVIKPEDIAIRNSIILDQVL